MGFFSRVSNLKPSRSFDSLSDSEEKENPTGGLARVIPNDPDFGASPTLKTFYEGKNSCAPQYDWVDSPPKQLSKKAAKSHDRVAIKIFKVKDKSQETVSGKTPLKIHAIEVQSPVLVTALKDVVKDEGVFLESSETARFQEPFKPLFFSYDKILSLFKNEKDGGLLKIHLKLLMEVLDELFGTTFSKLANMRKSGLISFKLAWTFFPRNCVVYSGTQECTQVVKVVDTNTVADNDGRRFEMTCKQLAFDGERFNWRNTKLKIPPFQGNMPITSLPCFPLEFHADRKGVEARLTERAKKVLEYQGLKYCLYEGVGLLITETDVVKHNVSGRILIDHFGYHKHHKGLVRRDHSGGPPPHAPPPPGWPRGPPPPRALPPPPPMLSSNPFLDDDGRPPPPTPPFPPAVEKKAYATRLSEEKQKDNVNDMLKREGDLIFMSPILPGFSLKSKLWLNFYIDDISPIKWNDDAYSHLVYPEEQKDLVLTFVSNHQHLKNDTSDVILGKGQGLILLLSGPPGTGKTLTAEAVADKTRRPLYYLQAEDLGTNASNLGPKIKTVFEMATEWNAVILLDEADVFMAERSPADIARNELVSIFLRELEYFQGIIFLTTNLYETIDKAFRSRVNIHLLFDSLPMHARKVLWEKVLGRIEGGESVGDKVLEELKKWELNGREINNTVKTVRTWCIIKGFEMNLERLEAGIRVTSPQAKKVGK